jgi:predicted DsbA family dithiol-disulfide isomerase
MDVHLWSDIVCPWCYLGKRRFDHALAAFEHRDRVHVAHRSFQLDPAKPRHQTANRRAMLRAKYQLSEQQVQEMDTRMEGLAAAEGLAYHLTEAGLTGNTLDAHQLVHLGKDRGREDAVIERLYRAYFTEQRSIFEREALVALASEAGLDEGEARDALEQDAFVNAVTADVNEARSFGVTGVPFFVVGGRYSLSGAQPTELFGQALARAWEERVTAS